MPCGQQQAGRHPPSVCLCLRVTRKCTCCNDGHGVPGLRSACGESCPAAVPPPAASPAAAAAAGCLAAELHRCGIHQQRALGASGGRSDLCVCGVTDEGHKSTIHTIDKIGVILMRWCAMDEGLLSSLIICCSAAPHRSVTRCTRERVLTGRWCLMSALVKVLVDTKPKNHIRSDSELLAVV